MNCNCPFASTLEPCRNIECFMEKAKKAWSGALEKKFSYFEDSIKCQGILLKSQWKWLQVIANNLENYPKTTLISVLNARDGISNILSTISTVKQELDKIIGEISKVQLNGEATP